MKKRRIGEGEKGRITPCNSVIPIAIGTPCNSVVKKSKKFNLKI